MKVFLPCDICHPGMVSVEVDSLEEAYELASRSDFCNENVDFEICDEQSDCLMIIPDGVIMNESHDELVPSCPTDKTSPWRGDQCSCQNCDWSGDRADCDPVDDIFQRVDAGEPMPAGQCPECGALCHSDE